MPTLTKLQDKETITSLELVEQINIFRKEEGRSELQHKTLIRTIRDEFEEEITENKIVLSEYKDKSGKTNVMFELTLSQAKQVLVKESKMVRKAVIKYIEELEKQLQPNLQKNSQLTHEQHTVLALYELGGQKAVELATEIKQIGVTQGVSIGREQGVEQGMKHLCDNGTITIPHIMCYIKDTYAEHMNFVCDIPSTEWTRYLTHMGYLELKHFPRKDKDGMEARPCYQPTENFTKVFVEQGMAIAREIDNRGKVEIVYTVEIQRFLNSDLFKNSFFKYLSKIYPSAKKVANL